MAVIDRDALLAPISEEAPSGEDLEYDPAYIELERISQHTAEQQYGDTVIPGEEPDWRQVRKQCLGVLERTKDLRVLTKLSQAVLNTDDLIAFSDVLSATRTCIESFWDSLHPMLDVDEDNDPTMRVNALLPFIDPESTIRYVRQAALVNSPALGRISMRDVLVAEGEMPAPRNEERKPPDKATIDAAFMDADLETMKATHAAVLQAMDDTRGIEDFMTDQVGAANAASLRPLVDILREIQRVLETQLENRGVTLGELEEAGAAEEAASSGAAAMGQPSSSGHLVGSLGGDMQGRQEAILAIRRVSEYFERHEPSSPVPLLLRRAERLASMNFLDVLRDLAPGGLEQAEYVGGGAHIPMPPPPPSSAPSAASSPSQPASSGPPSPPQEAEEEEESEYRPREW